MRIEPYKKVTQFSFVTLKKHPYYYLHWHEYIFTVMFVPRLMCSVEFRCLRLPLQTVPFPTYPGLQEQLCPPTVLKQREFSSQVFSPCAHSLCSENTRRVCISVCWHTFLKLFAHLALSNFLAAVSLGGHAIPSQRWKTGRRKYKTGKGVGVRCTWARCLGNNWHYCTKIIWHSLCWRLSALLRCCQRVFCT